MAPKQTQNIGNTSYILKLEKIHITKVPIFPKTSYTVSAIPTQVQWQPSWNTETSPEICMDTKALSNTSNSKHQI